MLLAHVSLLCVHYLISTQLYLISALPKIVRSANGFFFSLKFSFFFYLVLAKIEHKFHYTIGSIWWVY